jgi:hypothetical protein
MVLWKQIFNVIFFINVWCGMIDDMLIGPVILDGRTTGKNYLDVQQNEVPKQLEDVVVRSEGLM